MEIFYRPDFRIVFLKKKTNKPFTSKTMDQKKKYEYFFQVNFFQGNDFETQKMSTKFVR